MLFKSISKSFKCELFIIEELGTEKSKIFDLQGVSVIFLKISDI